jgi:hypothetical protein
VGKVTRKGISKEAATKAKEEEGELGFGKMLRCRVRYFTDGAVIGSKAFVNEAFAAAREQFTEKRKDGARRMRGAGSAAKSVLWRVWWSDMVVPTFNHWWVSLSGASDWNRTLRWRGVCRKVCVTYG